jgi:hypothetical protein
MKLVYLSAGNLRNSNFIKDLVYHYKPLGKSILLHEGFGSIQDTRFVTKRISALMSEEMIVNNGWSGDQRGILKRTEEGIQVNADFLHSCFETVDLVVLNPIVLAGDEVNLAGGLEVARALRAALALEATHLFPENLRSPLATERHDLGLDAAERLASLKQVYEEEATALNNALALLPSILSTPAKMLPQT